MNQTAPMMQMLHSRALLTLTGHPHHGSSGSLRRGAEARLGRGLLAPVRNARKTAGKTTAVGAGLVVSRHKDCVVGDAGAVRFRKRARRYKAATLPTPSSATGAMKAIVV